MRAACLLLTLACAPGFAQKAAPVTLSPSPLGFSAKILTGGTCSIPLLNVVPPGTPVKIYAAEKLG